ncbi:MAG TPA: dethiobiotin synthase [Bacillus bacterium]|nr:dethiobiotin synthase [Bacillus sp. (in: firmicutes)]
MPKGVFIIGTDTDVGKTIVTAGLMHVLRKTGHNAIYFKAALSGAVEAGGGELIPGDTELVSTVSDLNEAYENMTPYVYKTAVSPHLAAKIENKPIQKDVIFEKFADLKTRYDYIIAEGSGGIICPLIDDDEGVYTLANLIKELNMNVLLVARATLGTINHTVLTVRFLETAGITVKGIILNFYEENQLCEDNAMMIEKLTKVPIIAKLKKIENQDHNFIEAIKIKAELDFSVEEILNCLDSI